MRDGLRPHERKDEMDYILSAINKHFATIRQVTLMMDARTFEEFQKAGVNMLEIDPYTMMPFKLVTIDFAGSMYERIRIPEYARDEEKLMTR